MTVSDYYHLDCAAALRGYTNPVGKHVKGTRDDLATVWRTYQRALFAEIEARSLKRLGGPVMRNRHANTGDDIPVRWPGYWSRLSDAELMELYDTLIDANYRPRRTRKASPSNE